MHLYVQQSCAEIMSKRCTSKLCAGQEVERIATCCSALQFVAVRCSVLQCVAGYEYWAYTDAPARPARRVAVLCSVLQCVAGQRLWAHADAPAWLARPSHSHNALTRRMNPLHAKLIILVLRVHFFITNKAGGKK